MAALLTFLAVDIRIDGLDVDLPLPATWLSAKLTDTEVQPAETDNRIRARLSRSGNDIVVRGRVAAAVTVPCVRCLEPAAIDVDAELSLLLQPASRSRHRSDAEYEFSAAEADRDVYDGETVVLDDFVRELILLEVPSFPLCSDDCPGIQPAGGIADEQPSGFDPRLAPLSAFQQQQDGPVTIDTLVAAAT